MDVHSVLVTRPRLPGSAYVAIVGSHGSECPSSSPVGQPLDIGPFCRGGREQRLPLFSKPNQQGRVLVGPATHVLDRMDRKDLEPDYWLHEGLPGLPQLLR
jgi:hypothetical protein